MTDGALIQSLMDYKVPSILFWGVFLSGCGLVAWTYQIMWETNFYKGKSFECRKCHRVYMERDEWQCGACTTKNYPRLNILLGWRETVEIGCSYCDKHPKYLTCPNCNNPISLGTGDTDAHATMIDPKDERWKYNEESATELHEAKKRHIARQMEEKNLEAELADVTDQTENYVKQRRVARQAQFFKDVRFLLEMKNQYRRIAESSLSLPSAQRNEAKRIQNEIDNSLKQISDVYDVRNKTLEDIDKDIESGDVNITEEQRNNIVSAVDEIANRRISRMRNPREEDSDGWY